MSSCMYEAIEHDNDLSVNVFTTSISHSCYHWHYDYELIVVLKGSIALTLLPETYYLHAGDIVLINSKQVHGIKRTNQENICLFIQLRQGLIRNWEDSDQTFYFYLNSEDNNIKTKVPYSTFVRKAVLIALTNEEEGLVKDFRMLSLIYGLIADLFEYTNYDIRQGNPDQHEKEESSDTLLKILEYVDKNYGSENLLEELCHYIGMSERTLYRFLKRHTDSTLKELETLTRLERAQFLLVDTDKEISYIAQECGFSNDNTFYRLFKKNHGVTPTEYRKYGNTVETHKEIKGYLDFNKREARRLLLSYL